MCCMSSEGSWAKLRGLIAWSDSDSEECEEREEVSERGADILRVRGSSSDTYYQLVFVVSEIASNVRALREQKSLGKFRGERSVECLVNE